VRASFWKSRGAVRGSSPRSQRSPRGIALKSAPSSASAEHTESTLARALHAEVEGFTIDLPGGSLWNEESLQEGSMCSRIIAAHVKAVITPLFGRWVRYCSSARAMDVTAGKTVMDVMIGKRSRWRPVKVFEYPVVKNDSRDGSLFEGSRKSALAGLGWRAFCWPSERRPCSDRRGRTMTALPGRCQASAAISGPTSTSGRIRRKTQGNNLFHSFQKFTCERRDGEVLRTDYHPGIISRVTGGEKSTIDGEDPVDDHRRQPLLFSIAGVAFGPTGPGRLRPFHVSTAILLGSGTGWGFRTRCSSGHAGGSPPEAQRATSFGFWRTIPDDGRSPSGVYGEADSRSCSEQDTATVSRTFLLSAANIEISTRIRRGQRKRFRLRGGPHSDREREVAGTAKLPPPVSRSDGGRFFKRQRILRRSGEINRFFFLTGGI